MGEIAAGFSIIWRLICFVFWFFVGAAMLTMVLGLIVNMFDAYYKIQAKKDKQ